MLSQAQVESIDQPTVLECIAQHIDDDYTRGWLATNAGQRCVGLALVNEMTQSPSYGFVEFIYSRLPSGDYGRGDVRRVIIACAKFRGEGA